MQLNLLVIENFLSVKHAKLNLANRGLVSIEGENLDKTGSDSNGAGKSSIINAILWNLYGSYGKDEAADDVVNSEAGKNCSVQSIWSQESPLPSYRITRYRKHGKGKNSITVEQSFGGDWEEITVAGAVAVQNQINDIMGADEMVFRASCFAQQETPLDIPSMSDKELKLLLERCMPFGNLSDWHDKAKKEVSEQSSKVAALKSKSTSLGFRQDVLTEELDEATKSFANYVEECKVANKKINSAIEEKLRALDVAATKSNVREAMERLAQVELRIAKVSYRDVGECEFRISNTKRDIHLLEEQLEETDTTCPTCNQEIKDITSIRNDRKSKIKELQRVLKALENKLILTSHNRKTFLQLEIEKKSIEKDIVERRSWDAATVRLRSEIALLQRSKLGTGANPHKATMDRLSEALRAIKEDIRTVGEELIKEQAQLDILQAAQTTFSPSGLRYHMLEKIAPELTNNTNRYLSILTDGAIQAVWSTVTRGSTGDFKEKFSIEARMEGRTKFGLLSGGEKRKVRLACFFALQDLIASRATKNIELWCGDEIDEALDAAGIERLMALLSEKAKGKSTILVISHNELREWIPNHAVVTRENGVSTITGYLND